MTVNPNHLEDLFLLSATDFGPHNAYWQQRAMYTFKRVPDWAKGYDCLSQISIPLFLQYSDWAMDEILYDYLFIRLKDSTNTAAIDEMIEDLKVLKPEGDYKVRYKAL